MVKATKTKPKKWKPTGKPIPIRSRTDKAKARSLGLISGFVSKLPKGRPKKAPVAAATDSAPKRPRGRPPKKAAASKTASAKKNQSAVQSGSPATSTRSSSPKKGSAPRAHTNWNTPLLFPVLRDAVVADCSDSYEPTLAEFEVPRQTLTRMVKKFQAAATENDVALEDVQLNMVYTDQTSKRLLSDDDIAFLSHAIRARDHSNTGMGRDEVITVIQTLAGTSNRKKCTDHYDYLIRNKFLTGVKREGRVVKAQKTTDKRSQITAEQQLRWHATIDTAFEEQKRLNQPEILFETLAEYFVCNLDETCLMNSDGKVSIVASADRKKTEKMMDDNRTSITVIRTGFASGAQGPFLFLAKGKTCERKSIKSLMSSRGMPAGSDTLMTPNAFLTDDCWLVDVAPRIVKGVRSLPVIVDYPEWWVVCTLDGFGAHCNVDAAQQIFHDAKILIVKEEGDTSHINQPYDQSVAKADKEAMRTNLEAVRPVLRGRIDQWYMIAVACDALKKIEGKTWTDSFKKVNLHPKHRVPAVQWLEILARRGSLVSGDNYLQRNSLYDAMPAFWKHLIPEDRHKVVTMIDGFHKNTSPELPVWSKSNVIRLTQFVPLDQVHKLRACYIAVKKDPVVLCRTEEETTVDSDFRNLESAEDFFSWRPAGLLATYKSNRHDKDTQLKFFAHMSNHAARTMWQEQGGLAPSSSLMIDLTEQQQELLNPTMKQVIQGFIMYDCKGKGAKQKIAKRRLDMISGNIASYSRLLNDVKRLKEVQQANELSACVAEISADLEEEKERKQEEKTEKRRLAELKKQKAADTEAKKKEELLPRISEWLEPYMKGAESETPSLSTFNSLQLKQILKYYFETSLKGLGSMKKSELYEELLSELEYVQTGLPAGAAARAAAFGDDACCE